MPTTEVFLLPGLHGSTALFDEFVTAAPDWALCRPVALPAEGEQTIGALADRIAPLLAGSTRFILLAESFSAPLAREIAERCGERIALLVLGNPLIAAPRVPIPTGLAAWCLRSRHLPAWLIAVFMAAGDRVLASRILAEVRALPAATLAARLQTALRARASDWRTRLTVPTLALLGTSDRLTPSALARAVLASPAPDHPTGRIEAIDAPHLLFQLCPHLAWSAIARSFAAVAARSTPRGGAR